MISHTRALSIAVALLSCVAAFLVPQEASAYVLRHRAPQVVHVSRPAPQRQALRPRVQSRLRVASRPSVIRRASAARPAVRKQIVARPFPTNRRVASTKVAPLHTFGTGGAFRPSKLATLPKPGSLGAKPSTGGSAAARPFSLANLPRPGSLGAPSASSTSHAARPFNVANLPKANTLGRDSHPSMEQGAAHPSNVGVDKTVLRQDKAAVGDRAETAPRGPKGAHGGGNEQALAGTAAGNGNARALAKGSEDPTLGQAQVKVVADQQKAKDDKTNLKKDGKAVSVDNKNLAELAAEGSTVSQQLQAAKDQLANDITNNAAASVIDSDKGKIQGISTQASLLEGANLVEQSKLVADKKAEASDKKVLGVDRKLLQRDKGILSKGISTASQASTGSSNQASNGQSPSNGQGSSGNGQVSSGQSSNSGQGSSVQTADNGQGPSVQSSDPGQGQSTSAGGTQVDTAASGGSSGGSGGAVGGSAAALAGPAVGGAALAALSVPIPSIPAVPAPIPAVPPVGAPPPPPVATAPVPATPDVVAAINPIFVTVVFKKDVSNDNVTAFLQAYDATVSEGPNADGLYKLQLGAGVPADQVQQVVDSMKGQTEIVASAAVN